MNIWQDEGKLSNWISLKQSYGITAVMLNLKLSIYKFDPDVKTMFSQVPITQYNRLVLPNRIFPNNLVSHENCAVHRTLVMT